MPVHNHDIAEIFEKVADLLEIEGANPFRVRAYRNAARVVGGLTQSLVDLAARGEDLTGLPGVGQDLAGKIQEIIKTGDLGLLKELEARTPPALALLMNVAGLGPKRVHILHEKLGITTTAGPEGRGPGREDQGTEGLRPQDRAAGPGGSGPAQHRETL